MSQRSYLLDMIPEGLGTRSCYSGFISSLLISKILVARQQPFIVTLDYSREATQIFSKTPVSPC